MLATKVLFQRMKVRTRSIDFTSVTFISMQLCETQLRLKTQMIQCRFACTYLCTGYWTGFKYEVNAGLKGA
jgi:hypothetical protein